MTVHDLPALYDHCIRVYEAMDAVKDERLVHGAQVTVYEGNATKLFQNLGLSVPYYSNVMQELKRMQCIEQLRRGGGGSPSIWILHRAPTPELWNDTFSVRRAPTSKTQVMEQMIHDLTKRVTELERVVLEEAV